MSLSGVQDAPRSVFCEDELRTEPIKWLKYLLLDRTGVESIQRIARQIHRFAMNEVDDAREFVSNRLDGACAEGRHVLIVAKLVPWDQGAQLKNYRMRRKDDVELCFREIVKDARCGAHEIWCCESQMAMTGLNLGGRISFPARSTEQILELVWYASPRMLEEVYLEGFQHPYLRATRVMPEPQFRLESVLVPKADASTIELDMLKQDFTEVLSLLALRREAMADLVRLLQDFGASEICFCFKVNDGILTIIDWDTEIESADLPR